MKTKYYLSLIVLVLIAIAGCKKKDLEYTSYEPDKIVLKYLIRTIHTLNGVTDFTEYSYDERKRLSSVKIGGKLTLNYLYNGNDLVSIESNLMDGTNTVRNFYQHTYSGGVITGSTRKIYVNNALTKEYTFTHTVTRGQVMQTVMDPGAVNTQYTFANGNTTGFDNGTTAFTYTYDSQRSIFTNALAAYPLPGDVADRFSKNNIIKAVTADGTITNYTYTYDVDGYPIALLTGPDRYTYVYATF